jgi:NAD(P)H-dependent nitrite reductase small subunit
MESRCVPPGKSVGVSIDGRRLAVFNIDGQFYVIDDRCPHRAGPLSEGYVEAFQLWCPLHGWSFDLRTGACLSQPGRDVRTYPVEVREGTI